MPAWLSGGSTGDHHRNEPAVGPIVKDTIKIMEEEYGGKKLRAVGYCFGAKYLVPHFNAGYIAHPSYVSDDELAALTGRGEVGEGAGLLASCFMSLCCTNDVWPPGS
ncbi:unnamed protein product [Clonostachys chloroleuca]|uniref:Dienelactone hydrolase domain-containing protein n=1 Tax=Clonostachys chloroleuca TaxID=1926264 RepID=A0AA35LTT5_9HYPO|nr:unnamed protein product [Clonostachys chloroleuca]